MAEDRLRVILREIAEEHDYDNYDINIRPTSSEGANYTSVLYIATISAPDRENMELFAKVSAVSEEMRTKIHVMARIYEVELYFYDELAKVYAELQEKHDIPEEHRLVLPKFYKGSAKYLKEILILEDLVARGYELYNRRESVTWDYASAAIQTLAKYHALSFAFQIERPDEYRKVIETFPFKMDGGEEMKDVYKTQMIPNAINSIREENQEKVRAYFDKPDSIDEWVKCFKCSDHKVIAHCDFRPSNLMYREKNEKTHVIPVDFQTFMHGNPLCDLIYFIYTGSDGQFRKHHYHNLIEHYYSELESALRRLDADIEIAYPRKDFERDIEEIKMFGLIVAVGVLPIVMVEAHQAPKVDELQLTDLAVKPNELYAKRLNEIVDEYVDRGLL